MASVMIRKNDQIMMSLVHYFVTKQDYAPIHVQGVKDEIWLENLNGPYRIIRISCNSIINEEQYKFDVFKMKNIMKQIKKKTLCWKVNALNICLDMSQKVDKTDNDKIETISVNSLNELKKNPEINEAFPDMKNNLMESKDELELIINVTNDINAKTEHENELFNKVFAPKKIVFTNIIVLLCVVMYIISAFISKNFFMFDVNTLVKLGANNLLLVQQGQIWRLFTCAFLHVGFIHLIVNMYSLLVIGTQVETFIGKFKMLFIYLVSIITASLLSLVFAENSIVSVGASGAIFGLMGALLYFGYHYRLYLSNAIRYQIVPIILLNLLIGFSLSGIDNAAHIGGLIGGYLAAMAIGISNKSTKKDMINGWIVLILYIVFLSFVIFGLK